MPRFFHHAFFTVVGAFAALQPALHAQNAVINWVPMHTGMPIPGNALLGGTDYDSHLGQDHQPLWVCRVSLNGGVHPGKLLNNNCNVSYGGGGTEYHDFEVAVLTGGPGHWAPFNPADTGNMLVGGHESGGQVLYVCHGNYIHKGGGIGPLLNGDHDTGVHPGKLVNGRCDVEWGSHEMALDSYVQVFYLTPPPPPPPGSAACGVPRRPPCRPNTPGYTRATYVNHSPGAVDVYAIVGPQGSVLSCGSGQRVQTMQVNEVWQYTVNQGQTAWVRFFQSGESGPCDEGHLRGQNDVTGTSLVNIQTNPTVIQ